MQVNRLNPVHKETYLKKQKVGKMSKCTVTVTTATDQ